MTTTKKISFSRTQGGRSLQAPVEAVGKFGKCNGCGSRVQIPTPEIESGQESAGVDLADALAEAVSLSDQQAKERFSRRLTIAEVAKAIQGKTSHRGVAVAYRLHLLFVTVAMILLPIAYVAFVACVAAGVAYYTAIVVPSLASHTPTNRAAPIYLLAIGSPTIAGTLLVIFLIKPMFFYRDQLGPNVKPQQLASTEELMKSIGQNS